MVVLNKKYNINTSKIAHFFLFEKNSDYLVHLPLASI